MGAYIVNKKINEHAIEVRGSSTIGIDVRWRPKFDDALGQVASVLRTEQALLGVTELLEYFQMKHPNVLIKDYDLHMWVPLLE
jgi:hypothetical protein